MEERISGIYCIENIANNKKYVGQSENLKTRLESHKRGLRNGYEDCAVLKNAWDKYGEENFRFWIVELCDTNLLDTMETFWINELLSHVSQWGYNISFGGYAPMRGRKHTDESKKKMSESRKGWVPSEAWRKQVSERMSSDKNVFRGKN